MDSGTQQPGLRRALRQSYAGRWVRNAWGNTFSATNVRTFLGAYAVLVATVGVVTLASADDPDKITEAVDNAAFTTVAFAIVAVAYLGVNLVLAPWRLERIAHHAWGLERRGAADALERATREREEARERLREHGQATRVTVDVVVEAAGPLRPMEVGAGAIDQWVASQRKALGGPPPATAHGSAQAIVEEAYLGGALRALAAENRTPAQFEEEVSAWLPRVRSVARDELLRLGVAAHIATVHVFATNTGVRHLSEVRVRLSLGLNGRAAFADAPMPLSRVPTPPRAWGVSRIGGLSGLPADLRALRAHSAYPSLDREIHANEEGLMFEFEPLTLPPNDEEPVGSIVLAIPAEFASKTITGRWRATAKEAEGDVTGTIELHAGSDPARPDQLMALIEARLDQGLF